MYFYPSLAPDFLFILQNTGPRPEETFLVFITSLFKLYKIGSFPLDIATPVSFTLSPGKVIYQYTKQNFNTSITYNGGAIVRVCNLELLFWGGIWDTATLPSVGDIIQAVKDILNSTYLSGLVHYML